MRIVKEIFTRHRKESNENSKKNNTMLRRL